MDYKVGDKFVCIRSCPNTLHITKGKVYEVVRERGGTLNMTSDTSHTPYFHSPQGGSIYALDNWFIPSKKIYLGGE